MPSEQIRFWFEIFGSFAGLLGLAAIALELLRARRADTRDYLLRIHSRLSEISEERVIVDGFEFSNMDEFFLLWNEGENLKAYRAVYNFWELLIDTTRSNPVDKLQVMQSFGEIYMSFYDKVADVSIEIETTFGGVFFEPFRWFASEYNENYPHAQQQADSNRKIGEYIEKLKASNS